MDSLSVSQIQCTVSAGSENWQTSLYPVTMVSLESLQSHIPIMTYYCMLHFFQVISGFQLPKPKDSKKGEIIDPFIKIEIHGVSRDKQDQKSSVIKNNGMFVIASGYHINFIQ